jgi:hypothetical protein
VLQTLKMLGIDFLQHIEEQSGRAFCFFEGHRRERDQIVDIVGVGFNL